MSEKFREEDVTRKAQFKDFAKSMKQVLPELTVQRFETCDRINLFHRPLRMLKLPPRENQNLEFMTRMTYRKRLVILVGINSAH